MSSQFPRDPAVLLRKKNSLRAALLQQSNLLEKRVAILGGSTTAEVADQLELALLARGIRPVFYQSEYNKYYEDALFPSEALKQFQPDLVYLHTTAMNIRRYPALADDAAAVDNLVHEQLAHFEAVWDALEKNFACTIIQNNFEEPWQRPLGNLDGSDGHGRSRFVSRLNEALAQKSQQRTGLVIHDIHYLSARIGLEHWFSPRIWYLYKYALELECIPLLANHLAAVITGVWGLSRKCLVLDLDNTLWGGVIGDDGVDGIVIGEESAEAEAYSDLQRYVRALKERGIVLAVCSKNDEANARAGFERNESILKATDFAAFQANWDAKHDNISRIAQQLNLGLDSFVFLDDNPAERELVRAQLPMVNVPEPGSEISEYIKALDTSALFETAMLSADDLQRARQYLDNHQREQQQAAYANYDDFLASLQMRAEIKPFSDQYLERITQLINKTNQFNLTTRRCSDVEVRQMMQDSARINLYGKLTDKFGDNGLVTVVAGALRDSELHLDIWLMSCRVLKRGLEQAMLAEIVRLAQARGVKAIYGYYRPSPKNAMVKELYSELGFTRLRESLAETVWLLTLPSATLNIKHHVEITA